MLTKIKIVTLILYGLLVVISMAACTGAQSGRTPAASQAPQGSGSPPGGQLPPGAPGMPPGLPGGAGVQNTPQANMLPNQANTVVGNGTISVETYANLYFGSAGQIAMINVKVGDRVTKGTALAKLDTLSLEYALVQAQVNLDQAKLAQTAAKNALITSQFNLDKTTAVSDLKDAITGDQYAIKAIEVNLNQAQATGDSAAAVALNQNMTSYQKDLANQQDKLAKLLSRDPYTAADSAVYINGQKYDRLTAEDVRNKQLAVESAQQTVDKSPDVIKQAQKAVDMAQQQLDRATITAPFDGLIAEVNQNVGDEVPVPSASQHPIVYMIEPGSMELSINVNELDMPHIQVGQKASVSINAFENTRLEGRVTTISPIPANQGGLVEYVVKVTLSIPAGMNIMVGMNGSVSIPIS